MNSDHPIRVLSIDDHPLLSQGIAMTIGNEPDMKLAGTASTANDGIETYRQILPDITLMDLQLPDTSGIEALIAIRAEFPGARIILLTMFAGVVEIERALRAGARAYLLKSMHPEQMVTAIRQVHAGQKLVPPELASQLAEHIGDKQLTKRELEVLRHVTEGGRNRDIANKLFIAEETVKAHMKQIMGKLGASDRTQAIAIAARRGVVRL